MQHIFASLRKAAETNVTHLYTNVTHLNTNVTHPNMVKIIFHNEECIHFLENYVVLTRKPGFFYCEVRSYMRSHTS